jgi:hypothetical protein
MAQNSETEIIGLGTYNRVDSLIITWPTGHQDRLYDLEPGQLYAISEGMTTGGVIEVDPELNISTDTHEAKTLRADIALFPNPGNAELNVRHDHPAALRVRVLDALGRVHHQGWIRNSPARLQVEALEQQLYFVEFTDAKGRKAVRTWLKGI